MSHALAAPTARSLVARDRGLLWHPYAPLHGPAPYAVRSASGSTLVLESVTGERYEAIDAMSSWWCMIHGYQNPALDQAVTDQLSRFSHVMFGGLTHEPAVTLAERLVRLAPESLQHVFFADSGSVSVEVALKLALQYQRAAGRPERTRFLALAGGYHGDTSGAMSVCDPVDGMHSRFSGLIPLQLFLPRPPAAPQRIDGVPHADDDTVADWIHLLRETVAAYRDDLAGIIVEPILQGAGGMHIYDPRCLKAARQVADEHGILLIVDEIATGFGRTGKLFASEWADVVPDVLCLGKALTGGYLNLAALLCSSAIAEMIAGSEEPALLHGPTFMANPLACAVANASLELLGDGWPNEVQQVSEVLSTALLPAATLESVRDVRILGAVAAVELNRPVDVAAVTRRALEHGVWLRPFRNLVYTMPPYLCTREELRRIGSAITTAIAEVHSS